MNDSTTILTGCTKKYQIPLTHLEHRYIQQCTNGLELEKIYKELISGQQGSHPILVELTLTRIRNILPDSQILQQNKFNMNSIPATSVINNVHDRAKPKSNDEWEKLKTNVSRQFSSDYEENKSDEDELSKNGINIAEQYRLNADIALKSNNYQQSIDLYTQSLTLEKNLVAYINRAIAYFELNNFEASIDDCCQILSIDPNNINALTQRARCYLAKQQYNQARRDLDQLLTIDPENNETQDLMNNLLALQKTTHLGENEDLDVQPPILIKLNLEEDPVDRSMNVDIPHGGNPPFNSDSPSTFDQHNSSSNDGDDEDDMALGDEAGAGLVENLSEAEGHGSRSINVSPTIDEDSDRHELLNPKPLTNSIDQSLALQMDDDNTKQNQFSNRSHHQTDDDDEDNLYDHQRNSSSYQQNTLRNNHEISIQNSSIHDAISNSNFGSIIQSWLRDLVTSQSNRRFHDRPWSKSSRPWSLDRIQHDIDRYKRFNDYRNTIEVSKKLLQNGVLDYHYYAEYIAETLISSAECHLKLRDYLHTIQYASEALQYNKVDGDILICRAKAFENEKFLLFSYADYARVSARDFNYHLAQRACEKLTIELYSTEGESWREKLPNDEHDYERYFIYLKQKSNYSEENSYQWYETHADQLSLDACFVLAIRCYTYCIELQPEITNNYLKRAACYLKVFESQKVIDDCEKILKDDPINFLALYYKASAHKIARDYRLYELTLKEYLQLQPNNQIVQAEYYTHRHEQIPRKKRRIRRKSFDKNILSYEELEEIRLEKRNGNVSFDSKEIKDQCSYLLQLQSWDSITTNLIESIIYISRLMIRAEENYQHQHPSMILPFSYMKFCFNLLIEVTKFSQIDLVLSMMEQNDRRLLDELISFYSSKFDDVDKLNRLKKL